MIAISGLLAGCSATYDMIDVQPRSEYMLKNKQVIILTPTDGIYETRSYAGSGDATARVIKAGILRYTDNVTVIPDCHVISCLSEKDKVSEGYYIVPQILHWEDRATEWSGIPDKVEIKISIYNAFSNNIVSSIVINGKSKYATFGGDHPQDLLPEPVNKYISSLY